jgi:hypothetical protein
MTMAQKDTDNRCWCCGTRLVDKSRAMNTRLGPFAARVYNRIGLKVCPNGCPPTREDYDKAKAEYVAEVAEIDAARARVAARAAPQEKAPQPAPKPTRTEKKALDKFEYLEKKALHARLKQKHPEMTKNELRVLVDKAYEDFLYAFRFGPNPTEWVE